jgi:nucleotide-binding universal stress UspA family protein
MNEHAIIVGVDGSQPSYAALRWAAAEAVRRETPLRIVLAHDWPYFGDLPLPPADAQSTLATDRAAQQIVTEAIALAKEAEPGVTVTGEAHLGHPTATLMERAGRDGMVVVGDRGRGGFARLLLGSIGSQVATHATGPVVIVRGTSDRADAPIVVGVDDSPAGAAAISAAFEAASIHGCAVVAVRAWVQLAQPWRANLPPLLYDTAAVEAQASTTLTEALAGWTEKYPGTNVVGRVAEGDPGRILAEASRQAQMLVVGSHGRRPISDVLLGSTSRYVAHHADCPVLLIHPHPETA